MDGIEDDARYPPNPSHGISHHRGFGYLNHQKLPVRNSPYSQPVANEYTQDNNEEDEEEEQLGEDDDDDVDQSNSVQLSLKDAAADDDDEEDDSDEDGNENDDNNDDVDEDEEEEEEEDDNKQKSYAMKTEDDFEWHPKKKKLKSLISAYELAPRVPASSAAAAASSIPKPSFGGRNFLTDWTEHETFVLLDAWGDRFLQHGRKSLRSEEWQEVAEKVSEVSKVERTDTQCRNRLDTLKKKYKKEKAKFPELDGEASKWVYFKRMDKLMSSPPQQPGLSCGLDSGEYVFMNPGVYLNHANGLDEMRDSPENTESAGEEGSDGPQAKKRRKGRGHDEVSSFRLLAGSIQKFSKIYEKIENSKRQQMVELEKMRMDFHKELETQKRQILERLQCEISKLEQRDDDNDDSAENGLHEV